MPVEIEKPFSLSGLAEDKAPKTASVGLTHTFTVIWQGERYSFTSQVPTIRDAIKRGAIVANLTGQANYASLPFETRGLVDALSKCACHLVNKPEWFDKLSESHLPAIVLQVAAEVDRHHNAWFLGTVGVDKDGAPKPAVVIESSLGTVLPPS